MPYFDRRKRSWMGCVKAKGKRERKLFRTKQEALDWEAAQKRSLRKLCLTETATICLHDWATRYLQFSEAKYTAKTFKEKRMVFRLLFQRLDPSMNVKELTLGNTMQYFECQYRQRGGNAANKDRKNLLAAWNWGIKYLGLPSPNPFLTERFEEKRVRRYMPSEQDFWKVHDAADDEGQLILLGFLHTAARRNELFQLRWSDVHFEESEISLWTRKNRTGSMEEARLPMTDELYSALLKRKQTADNDLVFPNSNTGEAWIDRRKFLKTLCVKAGVKLFGFHAIRHLTASILAKANVSMIQIQAILRHKRLATTETYLHRLEGLRPALRVLSGKKVPPNGATSEAEAKQGVNPIG